MYATTVMERVKHRLIEVAVGGIEKPHRGGALFESL
jgi:hypothetical protein